MRRALLALLLLTACSGDDEPTDPHAHVTCDHTWQQNGYTDCEAACMASGPALQASGPACESHTSAGPLSCSKTFVFEGITGCCGSTPPQVLFGECE